MKRFGVLIYILLSFCVYAQERGIPTRYMNDPAVDLTYKGRLLFPDEVDELVTESKGKFDISLLNPVETSDLWKNTYVKSLPEDKMSISEMDEVSYNSPVASPSGIFRFNVINTSGDQKFYTMMLSKTVHSVLLAKSLLRKIGYQVPEIKYLPKIILKFKNEEEKLGFLSYLNKVALAGSPKSWVVEDLGDKLILQDLVVMSPNHIIYNLAVKVTSEMIQGRRLLSSLAIPLSIVNLTESVNMLRWNAGVVSNRRVVLYHDDLEDFQCTWDDGRWMARRIEKLTRQDWMEVVDSSSLPKPVRQILLEKILSRRNSVMKLFKIDAEEFSVDGKLNNGVELVDGKITQQVWPGYASRFAYGDPDSPLSDSDLKSWIKSRAISTAMDLALGQINQLPFLGTDIQKINSEIYKAHITKEMEQALLENRPFEMPLKAWVFPTVRGNLILSRNLVTGTYLGTDNLVQLVDTIGVSVSGGLFAGTMGVSTPKIKGSGVMPVRVSGGAQANYVRTYAHLRPVINIQRSLKYPFKNIFVPLVKEDLGKKLHQAVQTTLNPNATEEERAKAVEAALAPFKNTMNVGESLLVTDSVITNTGLRASADVSGKLLSASLGLSAGHVVISRLHIHRRTEDDFHIYKDVGHKGSLGSGLGIDSLIPVFSITTQGGAGHARVKFISLSLNKEDPQAIENASNLRKAIVNLSIAHIEEDDKNPFILKHSFKENTPSMNFLFWQFLKQNSSTTFSLTNPQGDERFFRRHYLGTSQGRNYQAYVNQVVNHWVGLIFDKQAGLSESTGVNPGYSFKGQAQTKFLTLDQELDKNGKVIEPFISLTRVWNGWSIKRKQAEDIIEKIRHRYKFQFYNAPILNDTRQIYMYNISVGMLFYKDGINHLLNLDENRIKRIFLENKMQKSLVVNPAVPLEEEEEDFKDPMYTASGADKFINLLNRYKKFESKDRDLKANRLLLRALSYMEKTLYLPGIVALMGGEENFFVSSKISGFREGDEDGDRVIISNSLGEFGAANILGPVIHVQRKTQMLEGEFFINWLMQRLI